MLDATWQKPQDSAGLHDNSFVSNGRALRLFMIAVGRAGMQHHNRGRIVFIAAAIVLAPVLALSGLVAAAYVAIAVPAVRALIPSLIVPHTAAGLIALAAPVLAVIWVPVICVLIEAWVVGFERSALRRLLYGTSASSRNDLFYLLLRGSGGMHLLAFLFSLGTGYWIADWLSRHFNIGLMRGTPFVLQLVVMTLASTLLFYWSHRLMHTRYLWEIHKVHHSAEEMNVVLPVRNHPIDLAIMTVVYAAPLALLGVEPLAATVYYAINSFYQCFVHSGIEMRSRWLESIIITSNAHRLHHSNDSAHWGTNFGVLTFWDRLFGTYLPPDGSPTQYGVDNQTEFNTGRPFVEIVEVSSRALKAAFFTGRSDPAGASSPGNSAAMPRQSSVQGGL
jgi:sterol desaturase/sphingolipid hydroxylase (fatty acid hydroxylase superfamily)